MNETKFTPGPWMICNAGSAYMQGISITTSDTHREIAGVWDDEDAYLISAAPDMYRVLEDLTINDFGSDGWNSRMDRIAIRARAALAKARGGA